MGEKGFRGDDGLRRASAQKVHRTPDTSAAAVQDVGVDHRRTDVPVSQQFLDRADIVPVFEQMGRE